MKTERLPCAFVTRPDDMPVLRAGEASASESPTLEGPTPAPAGQLFDQASRRVLRFLREHVPLALWAVTRVENGRQTYLAVEGDGYGLREGDFQQWAATLCVQMAAGKAPAVAPDVQQDPLYRSAAVNRTLAIGAYAGASIIDADGSLFGVICGLDPQVKTDHFRDHEPLLTLLSDLLTAAIVADRAAQQLERSAIEAQLRADVDGLTGVYNRGAWERLLDAEEASFAHLNDPTSVVVVDLNDLKRTNDLFGHDAGDRLLVRAAQAMSSAVRSKDPFARIGGDEFVLLLRQCPEPAATARARVIRRALADAGVAAAVGVATAQPGQGLRAALAEADRAMYAQKRSASARLGPPTT